MEQKIIEIDVRKCLKALIKSFRLILVITLTFLLFGILIALFVIDQKDEYQSTASIYSIVHGSFSDSADSLCAMFSYADIVKSYKVSERAEMLLGDSTIDKEDIYDMISVDFNSSGTTSSSTIYIHALSTNESQAINVANAVAEAFVLEVANLTGQNDIQMLDKSQSAKVCYNASSTRITTIFLSAFMGFFLACFLIVVREILSTKMNTPKDATLFGTLDIIGVIPDFKTPTDLD